MRCLLLLVEVDLLLRRDRLRQIYHFLPKTTSQKHGPGFQRVPGFAQARGQNVAEKISCVDISTPRNLGWSKVVMLRRTERKLGLELGQGSARFYSGSPPSP